MKNKSKSQIKRLDKQKDKETKEPLIACQCCKYYHNPKCIINGEDLGYTARKNNCEGFISNGN